MSPVTPILGRLARLASRLLHHGGSAFPGMVVERIDPGFLPRTLGRLPYGVVLVSGTNGKTTTTRMVASILSSLGLKVFTNPTGSNFTRGVASALLTRVSVTGRLDADIAVLELDEAYAVRFVHEVPPLVTLLLNVLRDQLDRFGEIDNTARLLARSAASTTGAVVLNREDPRIAALAGSVAPGVAVRYFGLDPSLRSAFPSDDDMHAADLGETSDAASGHPEGQSAVGAENASGGTSAAQGGERDPADVTLLAVGDHRATFRMDGAQSTTAMHLEGVYNLYNAAAALATVRAVQGLVRADPSASPRAFRAARADVPELMAALREVTPAFGRGESIEVAGTPVELLLVKNPMGFRLSLSSFDHASHRTMIAICDEYADGRDMSWLWDVDFTCLGARGVDMVSGTRAWDMALRLGYDQVPVVGVDTDVERAVAAFVGSAHGEPGHIYCTYTAMLRVRAALGRLVGVPDAGVGR
ncbi:MurT ligase domain-containing protein [uncultured Bifidobacterium sp.]|uniref:Mur ligase family protein n=1 Tax=uncultured Bifidobacterium sp. TaxID=165187 RepID=UPI0028DB78E9|nr:MurT ligase domain-containing protein [uncultured Bifidobacterium sp.]